MKYKVDMLSVDEIFEYEDNPRINKKSIDKVADSIKNYGFQVPIVVDEDMIILAGHTRLNAAKMLNLKTVPVHIASDLSDQQKAAYRIMDNKVQEFSEWDKELLAQEFAKLSDDDFDLSLTGFDFNEIEGITANMILFEEPEEIIEDGDINDFDDVQPSNIRMVSLFLNQQTEPEFQQMVQKLKDLWGLSNTTDTVYKAIEKVFNDENF